MPEIYIDEEKLVLIVGKPDMDKYEVTHTEYYPESDTKKIWVKKTTRNDELKKILER